MAYIYARAIHAGTKTLDDVPTKWKQATIDAYYNLYGIHLDGED